MQTQYIALQRAYARLRLIKDAQTVTVAEACRRHGCSGTCYHKWRKRYDGSSCPRLSATHSESVQPVRQTSCRCHWVVLAVPLVLWVDAAAPGSRGVR